LRPNDGKQASIGSDLPMAIEDYALIGDCTTAALVGRNGSIDWLCWPRFDSNACFAALLGTSDHGRWTICPADPMQRVSRAYHDGTMVLETVFDTGDGRVSLIDFMPMGHANSSIIRLVKGQRGKVAMRLHLAVRFDYGITVPWVTQLEDSTGLSAIAGPSRVVLRSPVPFRGRNFATLAEFDVAEGECVPFVLTHGPSHLAPPAPLDWRPALQETEAFWRDWSARCSYNGPNKEAVQRSLLTLKALTYAETGGIVAAPTTSLPEQLGGQRNWDYRYCWLRDATLTLMALASAGYREEAEASRAWLQRSVAGSPNQLQIMYGLSGERQLTEWEVPWLPGYQGAAPVRIGNAASVQLQLDVYGELMDAIYQARKGALAPIESAWPQQLTLIEHLEQIWDQPDDGIWEVRGGPPPLHLIQDHGMGCSGSHGAGCGAFQTAGAAGTLATSSGPHARDDLRAWIRQQPQHLHAKLRKQRARCESAVDASRRLPAAGRSTRARHHCGYRARALGRRVRTSLSNQGRH